MYQHEEQEQMALMQWAALEENTYPLLKWLFHIPNGGHRNKATAGRLKAAGVKKGVPDLCLPVPLGGYAGLYIEMKYGANIPTKEQREWLDFLNSVGYYVAICYTCEEAIKTITQYIKQEVRHGQLYLHQRHKN